MRALLAACLLLIGSSVAGAESVTALVPIRPMTVISAEHLALSETGHPGAFSDPSTLVGLEARVTLYPGRPILLGDVGPPALVERNQIVTLVYARGALTITTDGRALDRGAAGEWVRVMNVGSRTTVRGRITRSGDVLVSPQDRDKGRSR